MLASKKNRIASLLTGVSLAALSFMAGRTVRAATFTGVGGNLNIATATDFVEIRGNYTTVTNNALISDGFNAGHTGFTSQAVAVYVTTAASVGAFVNNQTIQAIEGTAASNNLPTAFATATAMRLDGNVPSVTNNGNILATAYAHYFGSKISGEASAYALGIDQDVSGAIASAAVVNSGLIHAKATAFATGTGAPFVSANANATGIDQAVFGATAATASVTNNANHTIAAVAHATAVNTTYGAANAHAHATGINQYVSASDVNGTGLAKVLNSGLIAASGYAVAIAHAVSTYYAQSVNANATANVAAIRQDVEVGPSGVATALVSNFANGVIHAHGSAYASVDMAYGTYHGNAYANANAHVTGISQYVTGGTGLAKVVNSGLIEASGYAAAYAHATSYVGAHADANANVAAIRQAVEVGPSGVGTALVSNLSGGVIRAYGSAYAHAQATGNNVRGSGTYNYAHASANANVTAINQYVTGGTGLAKVVNSGLIEASGYAAAFAYHYGTYAYANADANANVAAIRQAVEVGPSGVGTALVSNLSGGVIHADASAFAYAQGTGATYAHANANASAHAVAVDQYVNGGNALAKVVNSGLIEASGYAVAYAYHNAGTYNYADANAHAGAVAIHQVIASAQTGNALVSNLAGHTIRALGSAAAYQGSSQADAGGAANANAYAVGVSQSMWSTPSGAATVNNYGDILATANSFATSYWADANAGAQAGGVNQSIDTYTGTPGVKGVASVVNATSAYIVASANASARATHANYYDPLRQGAEANATAYGIGQEVRNVGTTAFNGPVGWGQASDLVVNHGVVQALAHASAHGATYASAHARAFGVQQTIEDSVYGLASVTNTALIQAKATAFASQTGAGFIEARTGSASAYARAHAVGVDQFVDADTQYDVLGIRGVASVDNHARILASAYAHAVATESAHAWAGATGVRQHVEDVGFPRPSHLDSGIALATVLNTGLIHAYASANATAIPGPRTVEQSVGSGTDAYAHARARGVSQDLEI